MEGHPGVDFSVEVLILFLLLEPALRVVEVPEVRPAVRVFVQLDAKETAFAVVLHALGASVAVGVHLAPRQIATAAEGHHIEAAVAIGIQALLCHLFLAVEDEDGIDLPVSVLVLLLAGLEAVSVLDEGIGLAVRVGVGLALQACLAVEIREEVEPAILVGVLFLPGLSATPKGAYELDATVVVAIETFVFALALGVELGNDLRRAVTVLVLLHEPLDARFVARDRVESAIAGGVGFAPDDLVVPDRS